MLLENLGDDWDSRVHRVRDNKDECLGCCCSNTGGEITNDSSVDLYCLTLRNDTIVNHARLHTLKRSSRVIYNKRVRSEYGSIS